MKPPFGVSTASVYQGFAAAKPQKRPDTEAMKRALGRQNIAAVATELANDLEYVTLEMFPELKGIKEQLRQAGAKGVLMSGSGPTIFGITALEEMEQVAARLKIPEAQIITTTTYQPPLH